MHSVPDQPQGGGIFAMDVNLFTCAPKKNHRFTRPNCRQTDNKCCAFDITRQSWHSSQTAYIHTKCLKPPQFDVRHNLLIDGM